MGTLHKKKKKRAQKYVFSPTVLHFLSFFDMSQHDAHWCWCHNILTRDTRVSEEKAHFLRLANTEVSIGMAITHR